MKQLLVKGNSKLGPEVGIFNLPAPDTCQNTLWCDKYCYARFNAPEFWGVMDKHIWRKKASIKPGFVSLMIKEIIQSKLEMIRIHACGDFFSAKYLMKWIHICRETPDVKYFSTTHRRDAWCARYIPVLNELPNVNIMESLDPFRRIPLIEGAFKAASADTYGLFEMQDPKYGQYYKELLARSRRCSMDCVKCGHLCWHDPKDTIWPMH